MIACLRPLMVAIVLASTFVIRPAFSQEPPLYQIYNTLYGTSLSSNQDLEDTYGLACSDTGDPCTQDGDCLTGTCDPIDDGFWLETNGYVEASARYAGYTQSFGYYTDACVGSEQVELFNVTTSGYLSGYTAIFLTGGGTTPVGFYDDPSGSPSWFSQVSLNGPNFNDHMQTYRAHDFDPLDPEYLIAWEDQDLGDADFNDLVVVLRYLSPYALACCEIASDCDDGEFCTGEESCVDHVCQPGDNPCPDDGLFCNGTEGCDEDADVCTRSGDPCAPDLICDEDQDLCYDVTIDVGDGSGAPGSVNNTVSVSLDNPYDKVRAIGMDICDVGDYLTCTGCEPTGRCEGEDVHCSVLEQVDGCCRVLLFNYSSAILIEEGSGPVFSVSYDVDPGAPVGECRDLNPANIEVADEFNESLVVRAFAGEFCFSPCAAAQDCDDGIPCTVDTCVSGVCQYAPRDCSALDDQCNVGMCDPDTGECVKDPVPKNGHACNDGNVCTENDICVDGTCAGTQVPGCPCDGEIYLGGAAGVCLCQQDDVVDDPPFNRPGRRGLSLTCDDIVDFCACYDCDPGTVDTVWTIECTKPGIATIEETTFCSARVTVTTGLCEFEAEMAECIVTVTDPVNNWSDSVCLQIGEISVDLSEKTVAPDTDSIGVDMGVINNSNTIRAMIMTIADEGNNLICNECFADPDRALGFTCTASEQADGTCRVILYSTVDYIREGEGVVARVIYDVVDPDYCAGEDNCVDLNITEIEAADQFNEELCICVDSGRVCFDVCGDIYPRDCPDGSCACGDGVVNLFDILEMVDIILGADMGCGEPYTGTACQMDNGDVPNGMPPYCGTAPSYNDCKGDGEVNIFDLTVITDMALGRMNCCDYCLSGQIY